MTSAHRLIGLSFTAPLSLPCHNPKPAISHGDLTSMKPPQPIFAAAVQRRAVVCKMSARSSRPAHASKPPPAKRGRADNRSKRGTRSTNNSNNKHGSRSHHMMEPSTADVALTKSERLQKVLSRLGVASRRQAEALISDGRVSVNGEKPSASGMLVNVWKDRLVVDGKPVDVARRRAVWVALHKPRGYVSTMEGNRGVARFLGDGDGDVGGDGGRRGGQTQALVSVGKIEEEASGLVLLTNERGAVPELAKPDNRHVQIWHVDCRGMVSQQQMGLLNGGVQLEDDAGSAVRADVISIGSGKMEVGAREKAWVTRLEVRLRDSRHRVVRRMIEKVGLTIVRMSRRSFGPVLLGSLRQGEHRKLTPKETKALKRGVGEKNKNAQR